MARGAATRRYAKALFQLAREEGRIDEVRAELGELAGLLESSAELRDVLLRPIQPVAQRRAVLERVAERLGTSSLVHHFFAFLVDQRRLLDYEAIAEEYTRLADEAAGVTQALVRAASPLSEAQLGRLRRALTDRTGRNVKIEVEVDPSLLGGLVAKVGDVVYDGSLRSQLHNLRTTLTRD